MLPRVQQRPKYPFNWRMKVDFLQKFVENQRGLVTGDGVGLFQPADVC